MSNVKTYLRKRVSVLNLGLAYARAAIVLAIAAIRRLLGKRLYEVTFIKIGRKWYCEVPGFPKELFEHTLMVGGAAKFLDHHAGGARRIYLKIELTDDTNGNMRLTKNSSTLTGGAFYNDHSGAVNGKIWLCPVTLFLLGKYPKNIQLHEARSCIPSEEQLRHILHAAIEHSLNDARQYFEDTIVAEYDRTPTYSKRLHLVADFADSVGYEYQDYL